MKFDQNKVFPYPVLRPFSDDYLESEFQVAVDRWTDGTNVEVSFTFRVSCEELLEEVRRGNAGFVATVACRETYHREVVTSQDSEFSISFRDGQLRGEIRVDGYIAALKKINDFRSTDINPEFGNNSFQFTPGDVLAQVETTVFLSIKTSLSLLHRSLTLSARSLWVLASGVLEQMKIMSKFKCLLA